MQIELKDFYGQHITIHNGTASGNLRFEVRTTENLNDVRTHKKEECPVVTDISLDYQKIKLIHSFLSAVLSDCEESE